ncbi:hypothetical protein PCE1_004763 [Barthelona sp. PCE]
MNENSHHFSRVYVPQANDLVLGIVVGTRSSDSGASQYYACDIGSSITGLLDSTAFEGADRKTMRGRVTIGTVLFCRIVEADKNTSFCLMSCVSEDGRGTGFGPLKDGYLFPVSPKTIYRLRANITSRSKNIPRIIGKEFNYEFACGSNNRVWIRGETHDSTLLVQTIIQRLDMVPLEKVPALVERAKSFLQ